MILSKNILPSVMDGVEELYYRIEGEATFDLDIVCLKEGPILSFDKFFNPNLNTFSIRAYTHA